MSVEETEILTMKVFSFGEDDRGRRLTRIVADNFAMFIKPKKLVKEGIQYSPNVSYRFIDEFRLEVKSNDGIALWVTLTSTAQGNFDRNAMIIIPGRPIIVAFHPIDFDGKGYSSIAQELRQTIRIEHVHTYI